jgi:hypothetical protein
VTKPGIDLSRVGFPVIFDSAAVNLPPGGTGRAVHPLRIAAFDAIEKGRLCPTSPTAPSPH